MNPRFEPGSDKSEAYLTWTELVIGKGEDVLTALKSSVSTWTEKEMLVGIEPTLANFIHEYPEWRYEELYATIGEEMQRAKHGLSRTG